MPKQRSCFGVSASFFVLYYVGNIAMRYWRNHGKITLRVACHACQVSVPIQSLCYQEPPPPPPKPPPENPPPPLEKPPPLSPPSGIEI